MRLRNIWIVGLVVSVLLGGGIAISAAEVTMSGSTTVLPIAQVMAEAIAAATDGRIEVEVSGGGSSVGIAALLDGTTMIADHSRQIKGSEYKSAVANEIYPFTFHVANDAIAVVVNPANPVSDLTLDQLQQIYQGKITNWRQVGGKDAPIAIVSRDTSSGTYETWESIVMNDADVSAGAIYGTSNADVANEVSMNTNAIGYVGLAYVTPQLKVLTVGGKVASLESAINHTYPIARPLFMSTNGFPSGAILDVILFILSDDGQRIAQEIGYAPIRVLR